MTKPTDKTSPGFESLEIAFQVAACGVISAAAVTLLAPVMPHDLKQTINQVAGTNIDEVHKSLSQKILGVLSDKNKCEKSVQVGEWIFHLKSPACR